MGSCDQRCDKIRIFDHALPPQHQVPVLPVSEAVAVVLHHLPPEPSELVVQEDVDQVELENQADKVQRLTLDENILLYGIDSTLYLHIVKYPKYQEL